MAEVLIKNLHKIFDRTEAVSGIDFSVLKIMNLLS